MQTFRVGDQTVAAQDHGGTGPALVLSHGFLMDHSMFDPQAAALAPEFRVVALDGRGFGRTPAGRPFDYWDQARDVLGVMDALGLESAVVGGMSQGGFTALRAALLAPERVRGLVLIDTQAGTEDPELLPLFAALREEWIAHGPAGVRQAAAEMVLGPGVDPTPWFERWDAQDVDELLLVGDALLGREDLSDRLGEIRAPALVVHGDADVAISLDRGRALAQGLGGEAQLVVVPGAGHAANLAQPDLVNRAIVGFLRRLEE